MPLNIDTNKSGNALMMCHIISHVNSGFAIF